MSHEWPTHIYDYGDKLKLLKIKPYFSDDINSEALGCPGGEYLLRLLKPKRWFAAHLHVSFDALVPFDCGRETHFLALDKCIPGREHLRVMEVASDDFIEGQIPCLKFDVTWLAICSLYQQFIPRNVANDQYATLLTNDIIKETSYQIKSKLLNNLAIPLEQTALKDLLENVLQIEDARLLQ